MFLSVFDIFKIGIGPSCSHTMGPMVAAAALPRRAARRPTACPARRAAGSGDAPRLARLHRQGPRHRPRGDPRPARLRPDTLDPDEAERRSTELRRDAAASTPPGLRRSPSIPTTDLVFDYGPPLPGHANGMVFAAPSTPPATCILAETYYSIGGGFVVTAARAEGARPSRATDADGQLALSRSPRAAEMLAMGAGLRPVDRRDEARQRERPAGRRDARRRPRPDLGG